MDGTEKEPDGSEESWLRFRGSRDRALATVVLSIKPSLLYLIGADPEDPVAVWQTLQSQFQRKTWANKLSLRQRLHSLHLHSLLHSIPFKLMTMLFNKLAVVRMESTSWKVFRLQGQEVLYWQRWWVHVNRVWRLSQGRGDYRTSVHYSEDATSGPQQNGVSERIDELNSRGDSAINTTWLRSTSSLLGWSSIHSSIPNQPKLSTLNDMTPLKHGTTRNQTSGTCESLVVPDKFTSVRQWCYSCSWSARKEAYWYNSKI